MTTENMSKGPGLYFGIGKKARELLNKDYQSGDHKFTVTTYSSNGVAITSSAIKKGSLFVGDVNTQIKHNNITTDIRVDTDSNVSVLTAVVDQPAPGVKSLLSFRVPDQRSGKLELQYLHDYMGVSASSGLTANPIVNFSGVIGTNQICAGTDLSFDTQTGNFTKCDAGLSLTHADLIASLTLNEKGDSMRASYYQSVNSLTSVGGEMSYRLSSGENSFCVGGEYVMDPLTVVKGKLSNSGRVSAVLQHEWRPRSLFTVCAEVDGKSIENSARVGLSVALKP